MVKAVLAMSEPICQALCYRGAGCLSNVRVYLPGTVLLGCRLFKRCQNLPAGQCYSGEGFFSNVGVLLRGTVLQGAGCLSNVRTYLPGTVLQ